jgi:hypothetical protein
MGLEPRWEWRAFGSVSSAFACSYCNLELGFEQETLDDLYLWIPSLSENVKIRKGDLKFKRMQDKDGDIEKWDEPKDELWRFPLESKAWMSLTRTLVNGHPTLLAYSSAPPSRELTLHLLQDAGCMVVRVVKKRSARLWKAPNAKVKVEWACISQPQSLLSIGLETWTQDPPDEALTDDMAKEDIRAAIADLGIADEPVQIMNYMDAITIWASGKRI